MSHNSINDLAAEDADTHIEMTSEHIRTYSSDHVGVERSRTGTFKHVYCDYDISQFNSTINSQQSSLGSSRDMNEIAVV